MAIHSQRFFNATADSTGRIGGKIIWPFSKDWEGIATFLVHVDSFPYLQTSRTVDHDYLCAGVKYVGTVELYC